MDPNGNPPTLKNETTPSQNSHSPFLAIKIVSAFFVLLFLVLLFLFFDGRLGSKGLPSPTLNKPIDTLDKLSILFEVDAAYEDYEKMFVSDVSGAELKAFPLVGDEIDPRFAVSHATKEIALWNMNKDTLSIAQVKDPLKKRVIYKHTNASYLSQITWSDDDLHVAFEENELLREGEGIYRHIHTIHIVDADGKNLKSFQTFRDNDLTIFMGFNAKKNELLLYTAKTFFTDEKQYLILDTTNGKIKKVLSNFKPMALNYPYRVTKDIKTAYYMKSDDNKRNFRVIAYDIALNTEKELYRFDAKTLSGENILSEFLLSPLEDELLFSIFNQKDKTISHHLLDIRSKKLSLVHNNPKEVFRPQSWSPDGNYVFSDRADEYDKTTYYILNVHNGKVTVFHPNTKKFFSDSEERKDAKDNVEFIGWVSLPYKTLSSTSFVIPTPAIADKNFWISVTLPECGLIISYPKEWKKRVERKQGCEIGAYNEEKDKNSMTLTSWDITTEDFDDTYSYEKQIDVSGARGYEQVTPENEIFGQRKKAVFEKNGNVYVLEYEMKTGDSIADSMYQAMLKKMQFTNLSADLKQLRLDATKARNTKRRADVQAYLNALYHYKSDTGAFPKELETLGEVISYFGTDICRDLVPKYLPAFPVDPLLNSGEVVRDCRSEYNTNYEAELLDDGRVEVRAKNAELGEVISVRR